MHTHVIELPLIHKKRRIKSAVTAHSGKKLKYKKKSFLKASQKRFNPPQPFNNVNNSFAKAFKMKSAAKRAKKESSHRITG